jgi:hypothetical protein
MMTRAHVSRAAAGLVAVAAALALPATRAEAQSPVAVVSARSAETLLDRLEYLVKTAQPDKEQAAEALDGIARLRDEETFKGIDRAKPAAIFATLPGAAGELPGAIAAVPIKNFKEMLRSLEGMGVDVNTKPEVTGFDATVVINGMPLYIVDAVDYAYASIIPAGGEGLRKLKPEAWLPTRKDAGDISLTVRMDRVPQSLKDVFLNQLNQNLEKERERKPGEDDAEYQGRQVGMDLALTAFTRFVKDGREMAFDLAVDPKTEQVRVEASITAMPDTPMAASLSQFASRHSAFEGFGKGAPLAAWISLPIPEEMRELMGKAIDKSRAEALDKVGSDEEKELVGKMIDALKPTAMSSEFDMGIALRGPSNEGEKSHYTVVTGLKVADGKKIESVVKEIAAKVPPEDKDARVEIDFAKAADGTAIHRMSGPLDDQARRIFGVDAAAYAAIQPDRLVAVFGSHGQETLEKALAAPAAGPGTSAPIQMVAHIAKLAALAEEDREAATEAATKAFGDAKPARDRVALSLGAKGNHLELRLAIDVPALRFFALMDEARKAK